MFLPFNKMLFMNKLEFSALIDCIVSETIWVMWFSVKFSFFRCIPNTCFVGVSGNNLEIFKVKVSTLVFVFLQNAKMLLRFFID